MLLVFSVVAVMLRVPLPFYWPLPPFAPHRCGRHRRNDKERWGQQFAQARRQMHPHAYAAGMGGIFFGMFEGPVQPAGPIFGPKAAHLQGILAFSMGQNAPAQTQNGVKTLV